MDTPKRIQELVDGKPPEVRRVIAEVFAIEKVKLYQRHPRGIGGEVAKAVKDVVQ